MGEMSRVAGKRNGRWERWGGWQMGEMGWGGWQMGEMGRERWGGWQVGEMGRVADGRDGEGGGQGVNMHGRPSLHNTILPVVP